MVARRLDEPGGDVYVCHTWQEALGGAVDTCLGGPPSAGAADTRVSANAFPRRQPECASSSCRETTTKVSARRTRLWLPLGWVGLVGEPIGLRPYGLQQPESGVVDRRPSIPSGRAPVLRPRAGVAGDDAAATAAPPAGPQLCPAGQVLRLTMGRRRRCCRRPDGTLLPGQRDERDERDSGRDAWRSPTSTYRVRARTTHGRWHRSRGILSATASPWKTPSRTVSTAEDGSAAGRSRWSM